MNILVTGGCGFIGSHLLTRLCKTANTKIVNIDKLTYAGNLKNIQDLPCETIIADIADEDIVKDTIQKYKIDTIIHLAAETHVDRSIKEPRKFLETDILGLFNLIKTAKDSGYIKRFLHVSTDEVYGPVNRIGCYLQEMCEIDSLNPTSPYSASKASADLILQSYYKTYNFPVVIVRPCNNYGTKQYPEKLIPMAISRIIKGQPVILHGSGSEIREWIHVSDCVRMIEKVLYEGSIGQIYNIGSGLRYTNYLIVANIINILTDERGCSINKYIKRVNNRPGNDSAYAINSNKIISMFNNRYYFVDMRSELVDIIAWYMKNINWWKDVNLDTNIYSDEYLR